MNEIRAMSKTRFVAVLKKKIRAAAFEYLVKKQGTKGGAIKYTGLNMAAYLQPYSSALSIREKQEIFSIRNGMVNIPDNFGTKSICVCGNFENTAHVYECQTLNKEKPKIEFAEIYSENIGKIKSINERFQKNMNQRENMNQGENINQRENMNHRKKQIKLKTTNENFHVTNGPLFAIYSMVDSNG